MNIKAIEQFSHEEEQIGQYLAAWRLEGLYEELLADSSRLSIEGFSDQLTQRLEKGQLSIQDIKKVIRRVSALGLVHHAKRKKESVNFKTGEIFNERVEVFIDQLIFKDANKTEKRSAKEVEQKLHQKIIALVQTGHPTYDQSYQVMEWYQQFIKGDLNDWQFVEQLTEEEHLSEAVHDIKNEHWHSLKMVENLHQAKQNIYEIILNKIQKEYPDSWADFKLPKIPGFSWFLTDMDGRNDYEPIDALNGLYEANKLFLTKTLRYLEEAEMEDAETYKTIQLRWEQSFEEEKTEKIKASSNEMIQLITDEIENLKKDGNEDRIKTLKILQMHFINHGNSMSGTHVRANESDIIHLKEQMEDLRGIKVDNYEEAKVLIENLQRDKNHKAGNLIKLAYCIQQTIDEDFPIVYLISDTESAEPVEICLQASREIGLKNVQIHPLIESKSGIENAMKIMRSLLENPDYRSYLVQQGGIFIQTGHSDLGRRAGQAGGSYALGKMYVDFCDLLKEKVIEMMTEYEDLKGLNVYIFPTGGEKDSRGGNTDLKSRLQLMSPMELRLHDYFQQNQLQISLTLQGGGGAQWIGSPEMAQNTVMTILEEFHREPTEAELNDPLYKDETYKKFADDFFRSIMDFHDDLMTSKDLNGDSPLAILLQIFGTMGKPSGSRPMKRQSNDRFGMNLFRAIGQAKRFQALGISPSVYGGIGGASKLFGDFNEKLHYATKNSPRFQVLMDMAYHSFGYTIIEALENKMNDLNSDKIEEKISRLGPNEEGEKRKLEAQKALLNEFSDYNKVKSIVDYLIKDHHESGSVLQQYAGIRGIKPHVNGENKKRLNLVHGLISALTRQLHRKAALNRDHLNPRFIEAIAKFQIHELIADYRGQLGELFNGEAKQTEAECFILIQLLRDLSDAVDFNNPAMG